MKTSATRHRAPAIGLVLAGLLLIAPFAGAGNPRGAYYCADTNKVFWFVQISDTHIGMRGSNDSSRLQWIVTTGKRVINPAFVVATGDLTDSTNGNLFGYPNGPYQAEWDQYKSILSAAGVGPSFFFDLPGNHDAYNDKYFAYYLANSVQGRANHTTQISWILDLPFGKYHFLGVNSADNTGASFSLAWPFGDYAGLDADELKFVGDELLAHTDAALTLVFGHHPVTDTGASDDTWLYYGQRDFMTALNSYRASSYGYGHTHDASSVLFAGNAYTGYMNYGGVHYLNIASLGKSSASNYRVFAVDCNGLSSAVQTVSTWPVVLITAPVDARIGGIANPYAYNVPAVATNPVRALVFDEGTISKVQFRVDGGATWYQMSRAASGSPVWTATWNASALAAGLHTLEVQAVGSTTRSHAISVNVEAASQPNRPPVAVADAYAVTQNTTLAIAAPGVLGNDSDLDGDALSAQVQVGAGPTHGTLTLNANGSFTYVPGKDYEGTDSFAYVATDEHGLASVAAMVTLTVTPAPATDVVTITSATYGKRDKTLRVTATSTGPSGTTLTVYGPGGSPLYGPMTPEPTSATYTFSKKLSSAPTSVVVKSSQGGSAERPVSKI
jgi:hypothetical protein